MLVNAMCDQLGDDTHRYSDPPALAVSEMNIFMDIIKKNAIKF